MREHSLMIQCMLYCLHYALCQSVRLCYILGLTVICARISDCLFSDWLPVNSSKFEGIAADPYHSLSRFVSAFSGTAQDWSIMFSSPAAVRHGLSCNWQAVWSQYSLFPDKIQSPTVTYLDHACAIWCYVRSSEMASYLHAFPIWPYLCAQIPGDCKINALLLWYLHVPRKIQFGCRPPKFPETLGSWWTTKHICFRVFAEIIDFWRLGKPSFLKFYGLYGKIMGFQLVKYKCSVWTLYSQEKSDQKAAKVIKHSRIADSLLGNVYIWPDLQKMYFSKLVISSAATPPNLMEFTGGQSQNTQSETHAKFMARPQNSIARRSESARAQLHVNKAFLGSSVAKSDLFGFFWSVIVHSRKILCQ